MTTSERHSKKGDSVVPGGSAKVHPAGASESSEARSGRTHDLPMVKHPEPQL